MRSIQSASPSCKLIQRALHIAFANSPPPRLFARVCSITREAHADALAHHARSSPTQLCLSPPLPCVCMGAFVRALFGNHGEARAHGRQTNLEPGHYGRRR